MDANSFLMGSGGDYIKFDSMGIVQGGQVLSTTVTQQTEFRTEKLLFWPDGKPKYQLIVSLQTDQRNLANPADTGLRDLYVKGKNLTAAVREAVKAAGASGLAVGGTLQVCYTGDDYTSDAAVKPKVYQARYIPPTVPIPGASRADVGAAATVQPNWDSPTTMVTPAHHEQGSPPAWAAEPVQTAPPMSTLAAIKAAKAADADPTLSNQHQPGQGFTKPADSDPWGDEPPF